MDTPNLLVIGQSSWISVMRTMTKQNFKLWNSNVTSVDVTRAEAQGISAPTVHCVNHDKIGRAVIPLTPEIWNGAGKCRLALGAGRPTGEEIGFVEALGGISEQGLAPHNFVDVATICEYKSGLLVASATIKCFEEPWSIWIDSGASGNYVRHRSFEGSQQYSEALKAHEGDYITVRLATGARVTASKVL
uniref:Uncharacterized protein n=1 Tax=Hyaloperonospora arabidopsidis (strain Emoy2) TaxID=559515 RepID=M4BY06_HYAAE